MTREKKRILVTDPEILSLATLIGTLKDRYHVVVAKDAAEVFKLVSKAPVDMFLLDTRLPDTDGYSLCRRLKNDASTAEIPIIFISSEGSVNAEEKGFEAGAVDYITKPFNAPTVLARIKNQLKLSDAIKELKRLHKLALDANPNTGLPGNNSIRYELQRLLAENAQVCVVYADLDHFKVYNDSYGFAQGDEIIIFTANVIKVALQQQGCPDAFLGHVGGDDFVFIVPSGLCAAVAEDIIRRMDQGIREFYSEEDVRRGYVVAIGRDGVKRHHPLVSLSMGAVDLGKRTFENEFEVIDICTETKRAAKKQPGSSVLICQRKRRTARQQSATVRNEQSDRQAVILPGE